MEIRTGPAQPSVSLLSVTAVKGFRLGHPQSVELTPGGAVGDRDFLVVDADDRLLSVTRSGAFLPYWSHLDPVSDVLSIGRGDQTCLADRVEPGPPVRAHLFGDRYVDGHRVEGPWEEFLSGLAGVPVRLVRADVPSGGYDVHPVTLMSEASVRALSDPGSAPLDPRLFRMLVTFDGVAGFAEDGWQGAELRLGSAVLRVGGPVPRCAGVQRDPDGTGAKVDALQRIHRVRGRGPSELGRSLTLGVYAEVLQPGTVSRHDPLLVSPA